MSINTEEEKLCPLWINVLIVAAVVVAILATVGIIIAAYFYKTDEFGVVDKKDWLVYTGSYVGTSLALVGTIILGYLAVMQNKQVQETNKKLGNLEEHRFKLENTCMIEFDPFFNYNYIGYVHDFLISCKSITTNCLIASDTSEEKLLQKFSKLENKEKLQCATFSIYFKETMSPIKNLIVHSLECNRNMKDDEKRKVHYKKFNIMSWYNDGVSCSFLPYEKLNKLTLILDVENENFWKSLNKKNLLFDMKIELQNFAEFSTLLDISVNIQSLCIIKDDSPNQTIDMTENNEELFPKFINKNGTQVLNRPFKINYMNTIPIQKMEVNL